MNAQMKVGDYAAMTMQLSDMLLVHRLFVYIDSSRRHVEGIIINGILVMQSHIYIVTVQNKTSERLKITNKWNYCAHNIQKS